MKQLGAERGSGERRASVPAQATEGGQVACAQRQPLSARRRLDGGKVSE